MTLPTIPFNDVRFLFLVAVALLLGTPQLLVAQFPGYIETEDKSVGHCLGGGGCSHNHKVGEATQKVPISRRPYDVLSYELSLDWRPIFKRESVEGVENRTWTGNVRIRLKIDSTVPEFIVLDAVNLRIDAVLDERNQPNRFTQNPTQGTLAIEVPAAARVGDTLLFTVNYRYTNPENRGFHLYEKGEFGRRYADGFTEFVEERIAYTMNQPENARRWMPCSDVPYDRAAFTVSVMVPYSDTDSLPILVSSNGTEQVFGPFSDLDGTFHRRFVWSDTTQMPPYLYVVNASRYVRYKDHFVRNDGRGDSVEILNYVWKTDYDQDSIRDGTRANAKHALAMTAGAINSLERVFGEFPYVKYGHTAVQPFQFGGMEHNTMSTINRGWLRGTSGQGIAHEIAHAWFGNLVTCGTWLDIWLNEGAASWGEALWFESWGGLWWYNNRMGSFKDCYLSTIPQPPIWGIPIENLFNRPTTYCKGAWVFHMLRRMMGDSLSTATIKAFLSEYRYRAATTDNFRDFLKLRNLNLPVDLDVFFDQWLYKAGHPFYDAEYQVAQEGEQFEVRGTLAQVQRGPDVPEVFIVPLTLAALHPDSTKTYYSFLNNTRTTTFSFRTDKPVVDLIVDDSANVLCEYNRFLVSTGPDMSGDTQEIFTVQPEVVQSGEALTITYQGLGVPEFRMTYLDGSERRLWEWSQTADGGRHRYIPTNGMAPGVYIITARVGTTVTSRKVLIYR